MNSFGALLAGWFSLVGTFLLSTVLPVALIAVVGYVIIQSVMKLVDKALEKSKLEKAAHSLVKSIVKVVLIGLLVLMLASRLGIDVTSVVTLAGVLTLAVSLALQNAVSNLVGGFTLLSNKPFVSGDFVEIAGQSGTVAEVGLTYTKLITADNKNVSIPNSAVTAAQIVNYTVLGTRRVDITVGASYASPVEKVLEALREAGAVPTAQETPAPFAAVSKYDSSSITYILQVWCASGDYWTTLFDVNQNIKAVFDAKGIEMTYPHLNVHLDK